MTTTYDFDCDACEGTPGVLWSFHDSGDFYGHTSPPEGTVLVQYHGDCVDEDSPMAGDLCAAQALAGLLGCRVHAIAHPTEPDMLAYHSDVWVAPEPPGPVVWHTVEEADAAGWYDPTEAEDPDADVVFRRIRITNSYELYDTVIVERLVRLDPVENHHRKGGVTTSYDAYLRDELFPLTGVGHEDGSSYYEIVSTDGIDPPIHLEW